MSIAKICRLLSCCKPSSNNRVTPSSLPEEHSVHVEVAPKPAEHAKTHHRYNTTIEDVLTLVRTNPTVQTESPAMR